MGKLECKKRRKIKKREINGDDRGTVENRNEAQPLIIEDWMYKVDHIDQDEQLHTPKQPERSSGRER